MHEALRIMAVIALLAYIVLDIQFLFHQISENLENSDPSKSTGSSRSAANTPAPEKFRFHERQQPRSQHQINGFRIGDKEKEELLSKTRVSQMVQDSCLPKLVCELHASISRRGFPLTNTEQRLITYLKETSTNVMGAGILSGIHFAAHMGQLLSGVEGNGCHNLYSNCPLSRTQVLLMAKNVRFRAS